MIKEEMTIHEALREVKMLDKRIASAIKDFEGGIKAVAYQESKIGSLAISDWETRQRASYDSINDLKGYASIQYRFAGMEKKDFYEFIDTLTEFNLLMLDKLYK